MTHNLFHILLVEDDKITTELVKKILNGKFYLDTASNAESAVTLLENNNYDLFLMDINLGSGPDGFVLTKLIKRMVKYVETPVIALTAYGSENEKEKFLEKDFSDLILKPFSISDLINKISNLLAVNI